MLVLEKKVKAVIGYMCTQASSFIRMIEREEGLPRMFSLLPDYKLETRFLERGDLVTPLPIAIYSDEEVVIDTENWRFKIQKRPVKRIGAFCAESNAFFLKEGTEFKPFNMSKNQSRLIDSRFREQSSSNRVEYGDNKWFALEEGDSVKIKL